MTVIQVYPVTEDKLTPTYKQNPENENEYELQTVGLESSSKAGSSGRKDKIEDNVSKVSKAKGKVNEPFIKAFY